MKATHHNKEGSVLTKYYLVQQIERIMLISLYSFTRNGYYSMIVHGDNQWTIYKLISF